MEETNLLKGDKNSIDSTIGNAAKGLSLMMMVKLVSKGLQIFLNFAVIKKVDPEVYGLTVFFIALSNFQTVLLKNSFPQVYQKRSGNYSRETVRASAKNLMNIGFMISVGLSTVIGKLVGGYYKNEHFNFQKTILLYTVANLINNYCQVALVYPILQFDYKVSTISEAIGFSMNTVTQWTLISFMDYEPCISFGIASLVGALGRVAWVVFSCMNNRDYKDGLKVKLRNVDDLGEERLVSNEMTKLAKQTISMNFVMMILKELYSLAILTQTSFIGQLTLIKKFGDLATRFVFTPLNEICFNLYAKLYKESQLCNDGQRQNILSRISFILSTVMFGYSSIMCFLLCYAIPTSKFLLKLLVGDNWVTDVFIRGFCINLGYIMIDGITGHLETFGKSIFKVKEMTLFNKFDGGWLLVYSLLMYLGQIKGGCIGVLSAMTLLQLLRILGMLFLINKADIGLNFKECGSLLLPSLKTVICFIPFYLITVKIMERFPNFKGFVISAVLGVVSVAVFYLLNKKKIKKVVQGLKESKTTKDE